MPTSYNVEEKGLTAMLATKRSAGTPPKVNLREYVTCAAPPNTNNAAHFLWNPDERSPEVQKQGISDPTKMTYVP